MTLLADLASSFSLPDLPAQFTFFYPLFSTGNLALARSAATMNFAIMPSLGRLMRSFSGLLES